MKEKILKAIYLTYAHIKELYEDANFLLENDKKERAYTFYHFSFEEGGRFFILLKCLYGYFLGEIQSNELNYKRLKEEGYERHIKKLEESTLKMFISPLMSSGLDKFDEIEDRYNDIREKTTTLNDKKNESIYICYNNNEFKKPNDNISYADLKYIKELAEMQILNIEELLPRLPKQNENLKEYRDHIIKQKNERNRK